MGWKNPGYNLYIENAIRKQPPGCKSSLVQKKCIKISNTGIPLNYANKQLQV